MVEVSSDIIDRIIEIVRDGGGEVFEQEGYINFFGVRNNVTNDKFNDTLYIYWKDTTEGKFKCVKTKGFTTKPGKKAVLNTSGKVNSNGVAIVKEGWYPDVWCHGKHKGKYKALVQSEDITKKITITRDKSQFGNSINGEYYLRINLDTQESGWYGINLHRSGDPKGYKANGWSEGCQVFEYKSEFNEMLSMANKATQKGQNLFSYYLTNQTVLDAIDAESNNTNNNAPYDFENTHEENTNSNVNTNSSTYTNNVTNLGNSGTEENVSNETEQQSNSGTQNTQRNIRNEIEQQTNVTLSRALRRIFGEIFPNDNNNRYINMSSEDISVIQYTEPSLIVDDLSNVMRYAVSYAKMGILPDKISYNTPVVFINNFMIPQTNITNFCLDYSSFVPQVMVEFVDMKNDMLSTNIPKPGSYIKVLIGGYGDDNYYKPIRQDFVITNITKTNRTGGEYQNYRNSGNPLKYKFTGILNVPFAFQKGHFPSTDEINARQAIFDAANYIGLGFATNFDIDDNNKMKWINTSNKSMCDFIKEITQHSCYSPYTFFTSFIDQYYVLNYVECRRLLSHGGDKTDLPQMIYSCIMPEMENNKTNNSDDLNNGEQKISYYFLTNNDDFKGWTNYIEEYYELNNDYFSIAEGYKKILTYTDKTGIADWRDKTVTFEIAPIDNMKRNDNKQIIDFPDDIEEETYIPLNLRQTTNCDYVDYNENANNYHNYPTAAKSKIDLGEVDTSSTFPLYYFASVQNDFQMKNFKKCGLSVRLQNYNPSITRYSRIWVDIYDMNINSITEIRKDPMVDDMVDTELKDTLNKKNDNIITFKEERKNDNDYRAFNRSLSGWYVVTDMKISYNTVTDFKGVTYKKLQTQLVLNRIDYKPSFKSEYKMAKDAINGKYKNENTPDKIIQQTDQQQE